MEEFKKMIVTKNDIVDELKRIGVEPGMELEVHSSLKSFGYVDGGAETVIDALKCAVSTNGSIFMPDLRLSPDLPLLEEDKKNGVLRKIKILSSEEKHSAMGIIADTFRLLPDTKVGEGTFAISAWGKNADKVSTGLGYLIDNDGKALLLGVDIYSLTSMHYVENNLPKDISDMFKSSDMDLIYPPNEWYIENGTTPVHPWYTIQDMAYEKGYIKDGKIGDCKCMFFDISSVINIYKEELIRDPYKLYGISK
jgi:aminoglycoside 3-N-acetyltransferase